MDNYSEYEQQFLEFEKIYSVKNKPPQPPALKTYPPSSRVELFLLAITVIAAMIVSANHSIPVIQSTFPDLTGFWLQAVKFSTFAMIEGSTLLLSNLTARIMFRKWFENTTKIVIALMLLVLIPVVVSGWAFNFFSVRESLGFDITGAKPYIALLAGSLPMIITFIGGYLFEVQVILYKDSLRQIDRENQKLMQEFNETLLKPYRKNLNIAFDKHRSKGQQIKVIAEKRAETPKLTNGETKKLLLEYLGKNPDKHKPMEIYKGMLSEGYDVAKSSVLKEIAKLNQ